MNRIFRRILRDTVKFIANLDESLPGIFELDMANILGKGVGVESMYIEVKQALGFISNLQKKKLIVFDVGANVGLYTQEILVQLKMCEVYAFEPSHLSGLNFKKRFIDSPRVKFFNIGLGDKAGIRTLYSDIYGSSGSSLTNRRLQHFGYQFVNQELVEINTLDNFCKIMGVIPDLLKIDVEGHEMDVLLGSLEVIDKISIIQFEFGGCNIDTRTFFQDFWYFFKQHDFMLYRITNNGPLLVNRYSEADEYFSTTNYLATNNRMFS